MIRKNGFASIPLMIALLLMAVAVPAVTSLVQNVQDTRNKASYQCSETTRPSYSCVINNRTYGWTCNSAKGTWECKETGYVPTVTKVPTNTVAPSVTKAPTSTVGPSLVPTWRYDNDCSPAGRHCTGSEVWSCFIGGSTHKDSFVESCQYGCSGGYCNAKPTLPPPTNVPTAKYGCSPLGYHCKDGDSFFCHSEGSNTIDEFSEDCGSKLCVGGMCVAPSPTKVPPTMTDRPRPTAAPCTNPGYHCKNGDSYFCNSNGSVLNDERSEDCHGCGCTGKGVCSSCTVPTASPTKVAGTSTPTPPLCQCINGHYSANCPAAGGVCNSPTPTKKITATLTPTKKLTVTATPTKGKDSCGAGLTCKSYAGGTACENAGGEIGSCTKSTGGSGNCCAPNGFTPTPGKATATPTTKVSGPTNTPTAGSCVKQGGTCVNNNSCCGSLHCNAAKVCVGTVATATPTAPAACKVCPADFKCYKNGSEYRWFVTGYVMTGFTASTDAACTTAKVTKPTYKGKPNGDANCDGRVDALDLSLWQVDFMTGNPPGTVVRNNWFADFTGPKGVCDGVVNAIDLALWQSKFNELMGKN